MLDDATPVIPLDATPIRVMSGRGVADILERYFLAFVRHHPHKIPLAHDEIRSLTALSNAYLSALKTALIQERLEGVETEKPKRLKLTRLSPSEIEDAHVSG